MPPALAACSPEHASPTSATVTMAASRRPVTMSKSCTRRDRKQADVRVPWMLITRPQGAIAVPLRVADDQVALVRDRFSPEVGVVEIGDRDLMAVRL